MLLTKIILQDYGVYKGKTEFNLTCTADQPIILVGGTNGAGKTTLFESVMMCLYGISAMEKKCTKKTYEQFLSKKIHRYLKDSMQADLASITVQFKFFHAGKETEFRVNRTWQKTDIGLEERLFVHKRYAEVDQFIPLDMVEESYWQSFIKDLIPKGVANLFFFDGEKVVKIAREKDNYDIEGSLKSLLGLDVVEQLRTDLQVNLVRNLTTKDSPLRDDYKKHKAEKTEHITNNERLGERLAQKQNELDDLQMKIELVESRISKIGGEFASKRESAKESLAAKRLEHAHIKKQIQENCSGYLPFSMIPDKMKAIKARIDEDQAILQEKMSAKAISSEINRLKSDIESDRFLEGLNMDEKSAQNIRKKILQLLDKRIPTSDKRVIELFGFSSVQIARIFQTIYEANHAALDKLSTDTQNLFVLDDEIQILERTLASAANDDEIGQMVSELSKLNSQAGMLQTEMNHIEEKMSSNTAMCNHIDVKLRNIVTQMYKDEKSQLKAELTQNVQKVLDEFLEEIKANKIRLLEQYLLENTQLLMRKKQFIEKIKIDSDTFVVKLFGAEGQHIPKDILSEGEKQMFATSVLWALAKTSGKPLPFMIDTPLARLDNNHQTNIVKKFLPLASHQTVIFSTDSEIELEYYKLLKPYIARSYALEFYEEGGYTRCHEGYFWNEEGEKIVAL